MKKLLSFLLVLAMMLSLVPNSVYAQNVTTNNNEITLSDAEQTQEVTFSGSGTQLRYVEIEIVDSQGNTVATVSTNSKGTARYNLPAGSYKAIVNYTSGNYNYYGESDFTVEDENLSVKIAVEGSYSNDSAQNTYNRTSYFNHVDIRVKGTYTTGTNIDLTTYNIRLANVHIDVTNPSAYSKYNFSQTFTNNNETYEWRKTGVRVYKGAAVALTCDIYDTKTGALLKSGFTHVFYDGVHNGTDYGSTEFVKGIQQCDIHQGLDFIIDPLEIIEAVFYGVRYDWDVVDSEGNYIGELPSHIATLPEAISDVYESGDIHAIDSHHHEGHYVIDEANGKCYTFDGWDWWSHETDNDLKKNIIGSDSDSVTITDETVIYGVWTVSDLAKAESHITITKKFVDVSGNTMTAPAGYHMLLVGPNNGNLEIPLSQFTYDNVNGVYSYELPIYTEGTYSIAEHSYAINGYDASASVSVIEPATSQASGHDHVTGDGTYAQDNASFQLKMDYATRSACAHVGQIEFVNTYTKKVGTPVHNYPNLAINKLDADTHGVLEGATFTLYENFDMSSYSFAGEVASGVSDESGYVYFRNIQPGTFYLVETDAPEGYIAGPVIYRVNVTPKAGFPTEILSSGTWNEYYEYDMNVEYSLDAGSTWEESQHFSLGTTGTRFRLAAFNEKVTGKLELTKQFVGVDQEHYPAGINVTVTFPDGATKEEITLNASNNWAATLEDLPLGTYTIKESAADIPGYQFNGINYSDNAANGVVTITEADVPADYDESAPVAEVSVNLMNQYEKSTSERKFYPSLDIKKVRDSGSEALSGAIFTLYHDEGTTNFVAERETLSDGKISFQDIQEGTYYLKEKAPDGYAENDALYKITVSLSNSVESDEVDPTTNSFVTLKYYDVAVTGLNNVDTFDEDTNALTVVNTKIEGDLTIKKTFGINNAYMPKEIKAKVEGPNNFKEEVVLSADNNWSVTLSGITLGKYTVTEVLEAVNGFPLYTGDSITKVEVTLSSEVVDGIDQSKGTAVLKNTYTHDLINPATFQIKKVDSKTGDIITSGAEFTLYADEDCTDVIQVENTEIDGVATFYGFAEEATYYLKETKAPSGYDAAETIWKVKVTLKNGEPTIKVNDTTNIFESIYDWIVGNTEPESDWDDGVLTVENIKKTGKIIISKEVNDPEGIYSEEKYSFKLDTSEDAFDQSFTLKAGESVEIANIPWGTTYTLTEDATEAAFVGSMTDNAEGTIWAAETSIKVLNTYAYTTHNNGLNIVKVDADNNAKAIAGAGFTLFADKELTEKVGKESFSDENGKVNLKIDKAGTYYLVETTAPAGYHSISEVYVVKANEAIVVKNAGSESAYTEKQMAITLEGLKGATTNNIDFTYFIENTAYKEVEVSVEKKWKTYDGIALPEYVEVVLYRNGEAFDTVKLDDKNEWSYIWKNLTDEYSWSVDEKSVPDGYTKTVSNDGNHYTITNTHNELDAIVEVNKAQSINGGQITGDKLNANGGETIIYYITAANKGQITVKNIAIKDSIPEGLLYIDGTADMGGVIENDVITWSIPELKAGESVTVSFKVRIPGINKDYKWRNVATVSYDEPVLEEPSIDISSGDQLIEEITVETNEAIIVSINSVDTGDHNNMVLWICMAAVSVAALAGLLILRKKRT